MPPPHVAGGVGPGHVATCSSLEARLHLALRPLLLPTLCSLACAQWGRPVGGVHRPPMMLWPVREAGSPCCGRGLPVPHAQLPGVPTPSRPAQTRPPGDPAPLPCRAVWCRVPERGGAVSAGFQNKEELLVQTPGWGRCSCMKECLCVQALALWSFPSAPLQVPSPLDGSEGDGDGDTD